MEHNLSEHVAVCSYSFNLAAKVSGVSNERMILQYLHKDLIEDVGRSQLGLARSVPNDDTDILEWTCEGKTVTDTMLEVHGDHCSSSCFNKREGPSSLTTKQTMLTNLSLQSRLSLLSRSRRRNHLLMFAVVDFHAGEFVVKMVDVSHNRNVHLHAVQSDGVEPKYELVQNCPCDLTGKSHRPWNEKVT